MVISERMIVDAPIGTVYGLYADLDRWPEVLPDVVSVDVHYMDGYNQEFSMTVERPSGPETVRGVRYCRLPYEIELVFITPPPGLSRLTGLRTFTGEGGRTTMTERREFRLLDDGETQEAHARFAEKLRHRLRTNLDYFRQTAERGRAH